MHVTIIRACGIVSVLCGLCFTVIWMLDPVVHIQSQILRNTILVGTALISGLISLCFLRKYGAMLAWSSLVTMIAWFDGIFPSQKYYDWDRPSVLISRILAILVFCAAFMSGLLVVRTKKS